MLSKLGRDGEMDGCTEQLLEPTKGKDIYFS